MPHNYLHPNHHHHHHHHHHDHHHLSALYEQLQGFLLFVWRGGLKKPYGLRAPSDVVMFTRACAQFVILQDLFLKSRKLGKLLVETRREFQV